MRAGFGGLVLCPKIDEADLWRKYLRETGREADGIFFGEDSAVQFAVLLRAHAASLKILPSRLEKSLAAETNKLSALVLAHQSSVERMVSLISQEAEKSGGGEGRAN